MKELIYVLLMESNDADAFVLRYIIKSDFFGADVTTVKDPVDFFYSLQHINFDVIVLDYLHPALNDVHVLEVAKLKASHTPVVCVSNPVSQKIIEEALGSGAVHYVFKNELHKLSSVILKALSIPVKKPPPKVEVAEEDDLNTFLF